MANHGTLKYHSCDKDPNNLSPKERAVSHDPERLKEESREMYWYPDTELDVGSTSANEYYLFVAREFAVPISHCPFCGKKLEPSDFQDA